MPRRKVLAALFYLQAHRLMRLFVRHKVLILAYHGFTEKRSHPGIENGHGKHLNIDRFRAHVEYLRAHYNVMSLDRLVDCYASSERVPPRSAVITIDDGYESTFTLAYPILHRYHLAATLFVTTGFIEQKEPFWTDRLEYALNTTAMTRLNIQIEKELLSYDLHDRDSKLRCDADVRSRLKKLRAQESRPAIIETLEAGLGRKPSSADEMPDIYRPLDWQKVREMMGSGLISIGSHTASHFILTRCSPDTSRDELLRSKELIEQRTGSRCTLFCYPNGQVGCFDSSTKRLLQEFGYSCGITTVFGMNDRQSDVFELKRLYFDDRGHITRFVMTVSGIVGLLDGMKRRAAALRNGRSAA